MRVIRAQRDIEGYWWIQLEDQGRPDAAGEWTWRPGEAPALQNVIVVFSPESGWSRIPADAASAITYEPRRRIVERAVDFWKTQKTVVNKTLEAWYQAWQEEE